MKLAKQHETTVEIADDYLVIGQTDEVNQESDVVYLTIEQFDKIASSEELKTLRAMVANHG